MNHLRKLGLASFLFLGLGSLFGKAAELSLLGRTHRIGM
jgi:hypothetical protein